MPGYPQCPQAFSSRLESRSGKATKKEEASSTIPAARGERGSPCDRKRGGQCFVSKARNLALPHRGATAASSKPEKGPQNTGNFLRPSGPLTQTECKDRLICAPAQARTNPTVCKGAHSSCRFGEGAPPKPRRWSSLTHRAAQRKPRRGALLEDLDSDASPHGGDFAPSISFSHVHCPSSKLPRS